MNPTAATSQREPTAHAGAARTLAILEAIARSAPEPSTVTGLARTQKMSKAVVHRLLQEMVFAGFVSVDKVTRTYSLGTKALMVGLAAFRALNVPEAARPFLERLANETGETATLSMRQGWSRVYVDQVLSPMEIKMTVAIGSTHPLYAGSSSKAILAWFSESELHEYLESVELVRITDRTLTSPHDLIADLRKVRAEGVAVSLGERQDFAASIAAPVFAGDDIPWGSISLCGPRARIEADTKIDYRGLVKAAAQELSWACGHTASREVGG